MLQRFAKLYLYISIYLQHIKFLGVSTLRVLKLPLYYGLAIVM